MNKRCPVRNKKRLKSVHLVEAVDFVWLADGSRHLGVCVQIPQLNRTSGLYTCE